MKIDWQEVKPKIGPVFFLMKVNNVTIGQINTNLGTPYMWVGYMRLPSINNIRVNHSSVEAIQVKMESLYEEWVAMMGLQHIDNNREGE